MLHTQQHQASLHSGGLYIKDQREDIYLYAPNKTLLNCTLGSFTPLYYAKRYCVQIAEKKDLLCSRLDQTLRNCTELYLASQHEIY